ncbi:translocation/assembly module TamB domain-containing protein [Mesorhizobium sp. CAU 1741]|uniref:translocation/assembly module TamB domain-containing protein n=1 Tax=Mesorhizobium sp. CAU 1741 TaxID=3140366 RepID=UPI00325ACED7
MRILSTLLLLLFAFPAFPQDETPEEERGLFLSFVEDRLSAPNRQIRIQNIQGALSSNAQVELITVADDEGVWLRIENASIVWSRSALIFSQRLQIDTLSADRIEVVRRPIPDESLPSPESSGFAVPELPIAVNLDELQAPSISFGRDVFGLESELSVTGRINLADGSLDTALDITRLDGPGGEFSLDAAYANASEQLELDLTLSEPENGIVANLLNIEGRPPVDLSVAGSGPLSSLDVELTLDAAGERILTGATQLRQQDGGLGYAAQLSGPIAQLIPAQFRDFFGAETTLDARGLVKDGGGMRLDALSLESAALELAASAETSADGFLRRLNLDASVDDGTGDPILLPVPGGQTTVQGANLVLSFGESADEEWSGAITIEELATPDFTASRATFDLGGQARNLDIAAERSVTFGVDGLMSGIIATRADIGEALGEEISLDVDGSWNAGEPIELANAILSGNGLSVSLQGDIADLAFNGDLAVEAESIAPFSGMAGRDLQGAIELRARGEVRPVSGAFDLTIDSTADELRIGIEAADNLLGGITTITGRVARGETGLVADDLRIGNDRIELTADGTFASEAADFDYALTLSDLALVTQQAEGRLEASGRASGTDGVITLTTMASVPQGRLAGKQLSEARVTFEGTLQDSALDGTLGGDAFLEGVRVQLAAGIGIADGSQRLTDLDFTAGGARATGALTRGPTGLVDGELLVDAPDISTAAALALVEASGAVDARVTLSSTQEGRQNVEAQATVRTFRLDQTAVESAELEATVVDLFNVPAIDGTVRAQGVVAGGVNVATLSAEAQSSGGTTQFEADATLDNGAEARAVGTLAPEGNGYRVSLEEASFGQGVVAARLLEPASLLVDGDAIDIDALVVDVAGGRIAADGRIANTIEMTVDVTQLPLSIANLVRPDLDLGGTIDAQAEIGGTRDAPDARFTLRGQTITAAALRQAGQSALNVEATGSTSGQRLNIDASVTSPEGLRASAQGAIPLDDGQIALDVDLDAFPLAALNTAVPGQDLGGTISGAASVSGTIAAPQATFDIRGASLRAAPLAAAGIQSLEATAIGRFVDQTVTLSSVSVTGPQGLRLDASGTVPLSGGGLSINLNGSAPLTLANQFLADRGTQLSGTVELNGTVSGSLQQPAIRGMASTTGAQVVDPDSNVRLRDINVMASIDGETVTIRSANAALATGGAINASGTISTNAAAGFPADIRVGLDSARYADGDMVVATVSGNLAVSGALLRDPLLSGELNVERAEISVPDNFSGSAAAIDVIHRNPPPGVRQTLVRARANDGTPTPSARPSVLRLNVGINAPARIFVRGRGLDTELGGRLQLTGPVTDIQPVGGFEMIRGRLSILGQRITFEEGTVTLVGDLDPFLNFVARSGSGDVTVFITVSGRVSELDISFSSQPELPEDEVLAQLIFNRSMSELSAFQIAQLAAAAAELAGGGNTSLLGSLRNAAGLDDLDIVTDSEGNAAVRAGRYIQDNIYLGVEAGAQGTTRGTINLDITEDLKARGSVGSDGDSSVGVFFERDY